jgi:hypothetical protein
VVYALPTPLTIASPHPTPKRAKLFCRLGRVLSKNCYTKKQLENVESFKYVGSILTNDGRCACEIKCRIAMAKAAFNKKRALFTSTLDLELRKKLVKCYI